jgi:hypothetical protein
LLLIVAVAAFALTELLRDGGEQPVSPGDRLESPPIDQRLALGTASEARVMRRRLRQYIFGRASLPEGLPEVERDIHDAEFAASLSNLARIDRLVVRMPLGFTSVAYHLIPRRANRRLVLYHNGHRQGLADGKAVIGPLLRQGYAMLVFAMPLAGLNTYPASVRTSCGRVVLKDQWLHNGMACLRFPLQYFLAPVSIALNYTDRLGYRLTAMVGLSGGGWTTMLAAAVDPRVKRSYPVAGSLPHYVIHRQCPADTPQRVADCFSDFEQRVPRLYRIARHLELYTLGAWGTGRSQVAVYNVHEWCCFAGTSYREWKPRVRAAVRRLGTGSFDAIGDTTHREHIVSPFALRAIEADLARAR